jgi:hypothetical protein
VLLSRYYSFGNELKKARNFKVREEATKDSVNKETVKETCHQGNSRNSNRKTKGVKKTRLVSFESNSHKGG